MLRHITKLHHLLYLLFSFNLYSMNHRRITWKIESTSYLVKVRLHSRRSPQRVWQPREINSIWKEAYIQKSATMKCSLHMTAKVLSFLAPLLCSEKRSCSKINNLMAFNFCMLLLFKIALLYSLVFCLANGKLVFSVWWCCCRLPNIWMMHGWDTEIKFREWCYYHIVIDCYRLSFRDIHNLYSLNHALCKATELI
jgi:hypothetical protein